MPHNLWNAAMGYKYLEDLSAQEENWAEAAGLCQKEVGYLVGLYEQTKLIQDVQKLADSEFRMGEYCRRLNRPADEAKLWYRDCAQLRRQILEEQDTPETREDLVRVCARLSEIAADEEDWEASLGYEREKYQTFEPLIRAEGLDQRAVRTSLSIFANSISSLLCRKLGRPEEAPPYLYQAVQLRGELCREQWNPEMVKSIYYGCIALKEIYEIFGQLDRAEEACRLNVEWCQELHQTWFKVFTAFHLASASLELSKLQFRQKDRMEEAEQSCTKALKLFLSLENQIEYLDLAPALFQAFYHMAELCRARGNLEETERFLKAADGVLVRVRVQREPDPEDLRAQLLCLEALGDLYLEQGRRQEAWDHLEYAVTVSQKLAEMKSAIDDYDRLAAALFRLGAFPGRVDRGLLEDAHSIWDQMSRYSPEYKEKRDQVRRVLDQEQKW